MRKISCKNKMPNGQPVRQKIDINSKLNYEIAYWLNQAEFNENHLPIHYCDPDIYPDFIALNTEKSKFYYTPKTALAFYSYDRTFDHLNGLYNAIYYNDKKLLEKYKKRYANINFVIAPDYSIFDDIWRYENESRLFKIRVIMLWFKIELGAIVIPNAIYVSPEKLPLYLSGFENCTTIAFSTKGHMRYNSDITRIKETVKYVVDNFPLKTIIVYSVCGKDDKVLKVFDYATNNNVKVLIVNNTMRQRNRILTMKSKNIASLRASNQKTFKFE